MFATYSPKPEIPEIVFDKDDKLINIIKVIKENFNPEINEVIIKIGKKSWAKLRYVE